jgi:hypothetical protein
MEQEEGKIGYVKYSGEWVKDGYLDVRKSAQALLGVGEAIRYFIFQQASELRTIDFEFLVIVKKGSWEIVIGSIGAVGLAYCLKAAQKMTEKDFQDIGFKDVFKKAITAIQWMMRIEDAYGRINYKKFENVKFKNNNTLIGIRNSHGDFLYVPKEFLDFYALASPILLKKMIEVVEDER